MSGSAAKRRYAGAEHDFQVHRCWYNLYTQIALLMDIDFTKQKKARVPFWICSPVMDGDLQGGTEASRYKVMDL